MMRSQSTFPPVNCACGRDSKPAAFSRRPVLHRCEATRGRLWLLGVAMIVILFLMIVEVSK